MYKPFIKFNKSYGSQSVEIAPEGHYDYARNLDYAENFIVAHNIEHPNEEEYKVKFWDKERKVLTFSFQVNYIPVPTMVTPISLFQDNGKFIQEVMDSNVIFNAYMNKWLQIKEKRMLR